MLNPNWLAAFLAFVVATMPYAQRYAIVDGPDYVIVGKHMFTSYVHAGACRSVEFKTYPRERVKVHICNV